ncbi:insulinase family protein [Carboxylicivirga sp. A043]|uniref:M16 family metallopeptidase n=1 Tax=Carboxylicivirga litoralis TaxID=2816963 RepID=UPI0021CB32FC|nr:pitrilysin family protein [Carboxylicivirga sp. A043]MCU4155852.1 insulinase family protein [Carboxylicivirga sp. A043]
MPDNIKVGTLDNGLTYYLLPKGDPGKVKIMMLSKTGGLVERPEQLGFTHMLEHTMFNGSKNFPGTTSVKELENMGMRPAIDYNAYTSPSKTEYFMTIPENNFGYLKKSLLILKDWMFNLAMDTEVQENEKKIIIEEINRGGTTASPLLSGTSMEGHTVLGTKEAIKAVTVEQLHAFYKDNYIPQQLALIVYGRMDEKKTVKLIKQIFGSIPQTDGNVNQYIDVNHHTVVSGGVVNKRNMVLAIAYKTNPVVEDTYAGLKQSLINNLFCRMMKKRLDKRGSSISRASVNMGSIISGNMIYNFRMHNSNSAEYKDILADFCYVLAQAQQHGFSTDEINYYANEVLHWYQKKMKDEHIGVEQVMRHFLMGDTPQSGKDYYQLVSKILPTLTPADFSATLEQMLSLHKTVLYDGNSNACAPDFNKEYILTKLADLKNVSTEAYQFRAPAPRNNKPVIAKIEVEPGKPGRLIEKVSLAENLDLLRFEKGIDVILHHTIQEKSIVKVLGKDGLNCVPEKDRAYFKTTISNYLEGYGTYDSKQARSLENSLGIFKKIGASNFGFEMTLKGGSDNFESMLQIFNLMLTKPLCPGNESVRRIIALYANMPSKSDEGTKFKNQKSVQWLASHPDTTVLDNIAERQFEYYKALSNNLHNSIIYISGMLPDNAEELVTHYIASITPSEVKRADYTIPNVLAKNVETKAVKWNSDLEKVEYLFTGSSNKELTLKDELILEAVSQYALVKMLEIIKDKHGLVYALGKTAEIQTSPAAFYSLSLRYMLDPVNVDKSRKIMTDEVLSPISKGIISNEEVSKIKAMMQSLYVMSFYEEDQIENRWLEWKLKYGEAFAPDRLQRLIDSISKRDMQNMMTRVVNMNNHFVILRQPMQKK